MPATIDSHAAHSSAHCIAFGEVFRDFGAYVPGLLRRLGVATRDIEDVAQDVFAVVHRQLPGFRGDSTLKTWLCGITLRVARNHMRRASVRRFLLGDTHEQLSAQTPPTQLEHAALRQRVARLERALDKLSLAQRRVFVLYELEELSMAEIASTLGCAEKTAYTRLYAARRNVERFVRRSELGGSQ